MRIYYQDLDEPKETLQVNPSEFIIDVKAKIEDKTGITVETQRLVYHGKQLKNDCTLSDYNIQKESTITLIYF